MSIQYVRKGTNTNSFVRSFVHSFLYNKYLIFNYFLGAYLRICVFAYLRICVFTYLRIYVFTYLRICVFAYYFTAIIVLILGNAQYFIPDNLYGSNIQDLYLTSPFINCPKVYVNVWAYCRIISCV